MLHVDNYLKILNLTIVNLFYFILKLETFSVRQVKYTPYKQGEGYILLFHISQFLAIRK